MLNIFYSRENIDKQKFIFENVKNSKKALIIVPDQFTLEAEKALFEHLNKKALIDIEVLSMSRLASRLLAELGGEKRTFIDKYGRYMLISKIAKEEKDNLKVFSNLDANSSFIEMVNDFISDLKQYNLTTDELKNMVALTDKDTYIRKKFEDLTLLYESYQKLIEGKYTDSEDYIELVLPKIQNSLLVKNSEIWLYGYDTFTPKSLSVIGELISSAQNVNVVLTYDADENARDYEIFDLERTVIKKLENEAKARGIEHKKTKIPDTYIFQSKAKEIEHIESELYSIPAKSFTDDTDNVTLVSASNLYAEAESAASYVLSLVRDYGYKYSDIKLICNDKDVRSGIITRIFREYGMTVFSDEGKEILQSAIVQYILSLVDIAKYNYRTSDIILMLKTGLTEFTKDEIFDIENYAIKYRIKGSMWLKPFAKGESEYGTEGLRRLENIRSRIITPLQNFVAIFKNNKGKSTEYFLQDLYSYLHDDAKVQEKIEELVENQENMGRLDLAQETQQIWNNLISILNQIQETVGTQEFNIEDFSEMLKVGLSQVKVGILPPSVDGIVLGTMQRTRTADIKALVVIGANEGVLPLSKTSEGLFSEEERQLLKENGIEFTRLDMQIQKEEALAIYRNLSKPTQKLYMSYSVADLEGDAIRPSNIFIKLNELFPNAKIQKDILNRTSVGDLINNNMSGLRHFTEAIEASADGEFFATEWQEMLNWYKNNKPEMLEIVKKGISFTNKQQKLGKQIAEALYYKKYDETLSLSASRLEKFSHCPFSHFIFYGLKPEERRVFEIASREIGDIYHDCIMRVSKKLTDDGVEITAENSKWMTITREECYALVREIINEQANIYREGLFDSGNAEKYWAGRIVDICGKACFSMIEQVREGRIISADFEVPFGRNGKIKPIEINLGDKGEKTVYIEGKIDRVDYMPDNRVKIIDYKTGNEDFNVEEARKGYKLQLMLYLKAALEEDEQKDKTEGKKKPAGVFYFKISEPEINLSAKSIDAEKIEEEIKKNFKLNGTVINDPNVIKSIAGEFSGWSDVFSVQNTKEGFSEKSEVPNHLLTEEEFAELQNTVSQKIVSLCQELTDGNIDIYPMKTKNRSACTYCDYKGICKFDTVFEDCKYNII